MNIDDTLKQRGSLYGEFSDNAALCQALKDAMRAHPGWANHTPSTREALEMTQHKIARMISGDPLYLDSIRDAIGYLTLAMREIEKQEGAHG